MSRKKNPDGTITIDGIITYNPETQFIKRRRGRILVFDKQIQTWRRSRKALGALKGSINYKNEEFNRKKLLKQFGG